MKNMKDRYCVSNLEDKCGSYSIWLLSYLWPLIKDLEIIWLDTQKQFIALLITAETYHSSVLVNVSNTHWTILPTVYRGFSDCNIFFTLALALCTWMRLLILMKKNLAKKCSPYVFIYPAGIKSFKPSFICKWELSLSNKNILSA